MGSVRRLCKGKVARVFAVLTRAILRYGGVIMEKMKICAVISFVKSWDFVSVRDIIHLLAPRSNVVRLNDHSIKVTGILRRWDYVHVLKFIAQIGGYVYSAENVWLKKY